MNLWFTARYILSIPRETKWRENPKGNKEIWESREMSEVVFMKSQPETSSLFSSSDFIKDSTADELCTAKKKEKGTSGESKGVTRVLSFC